MMEVVYSHMKYKSAVTKSYNLVAGLHMWRNVGQTEVNNRLYVSKLYYANFVC